MVQLSFANFISILIGERKLPCQQDTLTYEFNLNQQEAEQIAQALERNLSIKNICLKGCGLGDLGAQVIARPLYHDKILINLNLSNNNIGKIGVESLAAAMLQNKNLQMLDLSQNPCEVEAKFVVMEVGEYLLRNQKSKKTKKNVPKLPLSHIEDITTPREIRQRQKIRTNNNTMNMNANDNYNNNNINNHNNNNMNALSLEIEKRLALVERKYDTMMSDVAGFSQWKQQMDTALYQAADALETVNQCNQQFKSHMTQVQVWRGAIESGLVTVSQHVDDVKDQALNFGKNLTVLDDRVKKIESIPMQLTYPKFDFMQQSQRQFFIDSQNFNLINDQSQNQSQNQGEYQPSDFYPQLKVENLTLNLPNPSPSKTKPPEPRFCNSPLNYMQYEQNNSNIQNQPLNYDSNFKYPSPSSSINHMSFKNNNNNNNNPNFYNNNAFIPAPESHAVSVDDFDSDNDRNLYPNSNSRSASRVSSRRSSLNESQFADKMKHFSMEQGIHNRLHELQQSQSELLTLLDKERKKNEELENKLDVTRESLDKYEDRMSFIEELLKNQKSKENTNYMTSTKASREKQKQAKFQMENLQQQQQQSQPGKNKLPLILTNNQVSQSLDCSSPQSNRGNNNRNSCSSLKNPMKSLKTSVQNRRQRGGPLKPRN